MWTRQTRSPTSWNPQSIRGDGHYFCKSWIHYRFHKCHERKKGKEVGTVRTYDEGTSCSLGGVQRVSFPEDIPSSVLPALCTEDLLGASSTELSLFSPFFFSNPTPHQILSSSRSKILPHCSSHCPSPTQSWAPTRGSADVSWVTVWSIARRALLSSGGVCVWGEIEGKYEGSRIQLRMK